MRSRYTDAQIGKAFEEYREKTDRVMDVLRLAPLNRIGIYTVVNASNDFCIVNTLRQAAVGRALAGTIEEKFAICRELALSRNKMPLDKSLVAEFAGMPLDIEEKPFFFVAYDRCTSRYVEEHSTVHQEFEKGKILYTKKKVPFYLTTDREVDAIFPLRISFENISVLVKKKK